MVDWLPLQRREQVVVSLNFGALNGFTESFAILAVTGFGNTTKRLTHGTTTLSQEQEDHDHTIVDGIKRKIKPKSLYPSRDAEEAGPQRRADDDDRSQSRTRCKLINNPPL